MYESNGGKTEKIGRLGSSVDGTGFIGNLLASNKERAKHMNEVQWIAHVIPGKEWDYKK